MSTASDLPSSTLASLSLLGRGGGAVKKLRGFRKDRHTVPDAVNNATAAFFARLCAEELAEEAEGWFQRAREAFAYKRRDLALEHGPASARIVAKDFSLELLWALDDADPANYTTTRTLREVRTGEFVRSEACDAVFAGAFTHIVFSLTKGVAVEAVIDAVEALPAEESLAVSYPSDCAECTLRVDGVEAEVRCTGASLELAFAQAGSPRELIEAFGAVRSAFRLTRSGVLSDLV